MAKVDRLLATLRGEAAPEEAPVMEAAPEAVVPSGEFEALKSKIGELEARLSQMAPPPALEAPLEAPIEEVPPMASEPPPTPPQPPTELALFLHTRVQLLENRLELAQQEALRSGLLLRERDQAQRKAQTEVEELFHSIREAQRAANYDKTLRENASATAERVKELEARLALAQLRMVPAEDVLRFIETEEGRAELAKRIQTQLEASPEPISSPGEEPGPMAPEPGVRPDQLAVVLGRVSDLEARLEEAQKARESERAQARRRKEELLQAMKVSSSRFERAGGAELLVEAALAGVVECVRQRDTLQLEMGRTVEALRDEPQGSEAAAEMRGKLALAHKRMAELQADLDRQLALVQAWVKRQTEGS